MQTIVAYQQSCVIQPCGPLNAETAIEFQRQLTTAVVEEVETTTKKYCARTSRARRRRSKKKIGRRERIPRGRENKVENMRQTV